MFYANYVSIVSSQTHVGIIPLLDEECLRPGEVSTVFLTSTFSTYKLIFMLDIGIWWFASSVGADRKMN